MPSDEVICLSSDDEEDSPMKNLVDCDSSPTKIQLTPSVQLIKRENSVTKRKISLGDEITLKKLKVDSTETWIETAKTKNNDHLSTNSTGIVDSSSKSNFKNNSIRNSTDKNDSTSVASTSNGHKYVKPLKVTTSEENSGDIKKPMLVVKTKQPVNVENGHENVFLMFIGQCLSRERTSDMEKVVEKLKRKYEQLDTAYANSEAFADLLNEKRHLLELEKGALYMHIKDVLDEMKIRKAGRKSAVCKSEPDGTDADTEEADVTVDGMDEKEREQFRKQEMKIKRLEKTMELVQKRIKKYEAEEVDWNDEDDSMYMKLERYKKRMVELYNAWCKLTANHEDAGRSYLRPKHVKLTGIVTVDQAINSFVNSRLKKRSSLSNQAGKDDFFPDYVDILNLIHTHNVNHNLGMNKIKESAAAKSAFVKLGEYLKSERQQDFYDTFSMWYENDEDPAQKDPELLSKLQENREHGEKKLNEVFDEYTRKQEELNASGKLEEVKGTDEEDEDEDDEEDEEKDEGDDERDVSDAEVVDLESDNSAAEDADADKENGDKNTKNGIDKSSDKVAEEPEIVETAETIWLESKADKVLSCGSEKIKKNLPSTSKQSASTSTSFNNSDNKGYKSKVDNTDDDAHEDCDDKADGKPVLKLRSFAKPPEFWANSQEIAESDSDEEPAPGVQVGNDSSIEVIHIDISGDKSPKAAKTVAPNQRVQPTPVNTTKKKVFTRMVPVSSSRLCRLSTGDPVLKSPMATSTPNPNLNSNSNPNRHPRAGDSTPKRPVGASMPNRPIQASNTASPAGSGAGPQRKELKHVTFIRNNNQNNVPVGQPTEQTATSSSVTNGRVAPTVASLQTFRKTDVKKLQLANSKNIFNNDSNSNYNLNGIRCNSNSTSYNNSNNQRNNVGNKSGQRQVINPMATRKIVDRPINRTDVNVNNLNRLTPRNGHMS